MVFFVKKNKKIWFLVFYFLKSQSCQTQVFCTSILYFYIITKLVFIKFNFFA
jgi:hypothetical protein